jgi:hypothetical protein
MKDPFPEFTTHSHKLMFRNKPRRGVRALILLAILAVAGLDALFAVSGRGQRTSEPAKSSAAEFQLLTKLYNDVGTKSTNAIEMMKSMPARHPSNEDSIGIEIVGKASLKSGIVVSAGLSEATRKQLIDRNTSFEPVTPAQQASLQRLID